MDVHRPQGRATNPASTVVPRGVMFELPCALSPRHTPVLATLLGSQGGETEEGTAAISGSQPPHSCNFAQAGTTAGGTHGERLQVAMVTSRLAVLLWLEVMYPLVNRAAGQIQELLALYAPWIQETAAFVGRFVRPLPKHTLRFRLPADERASHDSTMLQEGTTCVESSTRIGSSSCMILSRPPPDGVNKMTHSRHRSCTLIG